MSRNLATNWDYITEAGQHYPSPGLAVATLRQLGKPPSSKDVDISHPSIQIQTALEIVASLADKVSEDPNDHIRRMNSQKRETVEVVKNSWTSTIGPWILLFLNTFSTAQTEPTTPHGIRFLDNVLFTLPYLLEYAREGNEYRRLKRVSSGLLRGIAQTWLQVTYTFHSTWANWVAVLITFLGENIQAGMSEVGDIIQELTPSLGRDRIAHGLTRFIRNATLFFSVFKTSQWENLSSFLCLLVGAANPDTPIYLNFLFNGGIRDLVDLLRATISRARKLSNLERHAELSAALGVTRMAAIALDAYLRGPLRIVDALDAGLVKTMLKSMQFYAHTEADREGVHSLPLSDTLTRILELLSLYMVYPSVRRRFTRSIIDIEESGLEDKLINRTDEEYGRKFQTLWEKCKESAEIFSDVFNSATEFWPMCANDACPRKELDWPLKRLTYKRCSSCWQRTYCSASCAKQDWKEHREKCSILSEAMKDGAPYPSNMDESFFKHMMEDYVMENASLVLEELDKYVPSDKSLAVDSHGRPLPYQERLVRGILILEFDQIEIHDVWSPSRLHLVQMSTVAADERIKLDHKNHRYLARTMVAAEEGRIAVVGFFLELKGVARQRGIILSLPLSIFRTNLAPNLKIKLVGAIQC